MLGEISCKNVKLVESTDRNIAIGLAKLGTAAVRVA